MQYIVPFVDPKEHYRKLKTEIDVAISDCLTNGDLVCRQQLRSFEQNLAGFTQTNYAVGVNSGYHALHLSLLAKGVGPGDEVITVAHTFVATVSAIIHCGAKPVLVDVGPDYNMDPEKAKKAITRKTRAILPVHLNGRVCDMEPIMALAKEHGLVIVEDAAQALGAKYKGQMAGGFGDTGCFSFYPFKALGGFGDGGAVITNDPKIAQTVSRLRYNGEDRETGEYHYHGYTALLDNVQAAVLDVKLRHLPAWIEHRREISRLYRQGLEALTQVGLPHFPEEEHFDIFQNYVIRVSDRDRLRSYLTEHGVETLVSWPKPMWHHQALGLDDPGILETEKVCREVLSLPMSAETTKDHVRETVAAVIGFYS